MKIVNESTGGLFITFGVSGCGYVHRGGEPLEWTAKGPTKVTIALLEAEPIVYDDVEDDEVITVLSKREGGG